MNIKVQWKKEVIEELRRQWDTFQSKEQWARINMFGGDQVYKQDFDVEYFIIDDDRDFHNCDIIYPEKLDRWAVHRKHVEEYVPKSLYKFEINDGLFEL